MNSNAKLKGIFWCFPRLFPRYSFTLLLSMILCSESVGAIPRGTGLQIAQQREATSSQANRAAAKRASDEGFQLYKQGTADSLRQARAKFFEALKLWQQVDDKAGLALALLGIGAVYNELGEKQKALEYFNQALPLRRTVGDKYGEANTLSNIAVV